MFKLTDKIMSDQWSC